MNLHDALALCPPQVFGLSKFALGKSAAGR
jgi:hypothetical protein